MRRSTRYGGPFDARRRGLSELLAGQAALDDVVFPDKVAKGLSVLSCGAR